MHFALHIPKSASWKCSASGRSIDLNSWRSSSNVVCDLSFHIITRRSASWCEVRCCELCISNMSIWMKNKRLVCNLLINTLSLFTIGPFRKLLVLKFNTLLTIGEFWWWARLTLVSYDISKIADFFKTYI